MPSIDETAGDITQFDFHLKKIPYLKQPSIQLKIYVNLNMKTRVNLTIEKELIQQIKAYAEEKQTSVSDLVEEYFSNLVRPAKKENFLDLVKKLPKPGINEDLDLKKAYYEERASKYGF